MRIVFISEHPYPSYNHHRYGLDYLMERGYEVEIWRVITNKSIFFEAQSGMYEGTNYHEYSTNALKKQLIRNKETIFYVEQTREKYFWLIMKYARKYIVIGGMGPVFGCSDASQRETTSVSMFERIAKLLKKGLIGSFDAITDRLRLTYNSKVYLYLLEKNPPMLIVTSTQLAAERYFMPRELEGNVMRIHSMDYDRFLETQSTENQESIVYCDTGYFCKIYDAIIDPEYYPLEHRDEFNKKLEVLFDKLEKHYGVPVIIAGHPKTCYDSDCFCGRPIVFNRTAELVAKAKLFLSQNTTALSLALLNNIPVIEVVDSYFKQLRPIVWPDICLYDYIRYQANEIGGSFLDLDDEIQMKSPWELAVKLDDNKRREYIKNYVIDSDKTDRLIIEYVDDFLHGLDN